MENEIGCPTQPGTPMQPDNGPKSKLNAYRVTRQGGGNDAKEEHQPTQERPQ